MNKTRCVKECEKDTKRILKKKLKRIVRKSVKRRERVVYLSERRQRQLEGQNID